MLFLLFPWWVVDGLPGINPEDCFMLGMNSSTVLECENWVWTFEIIVDSYEQGGQREGGGGEKVAFPLQLMSVLLA